LNNKIELTKRFSAVFLAIVLVAGTITALSYPSFMIDVQAQPYYGMDNSYNSYGSDFGIDSYNDKRSYGNDNDYGYELQYQSYKSDYKSTEYQSYFGNDNYKSPKDISSKKSVNLNKIKCINNNININGINSGDVNIGNKGQLVQERDLSSSLFGNGEERNNNGYYYGYNNNNKKDKNIECIINNNNNNTNINLGDGGGNQTIPPEPEPTTENNVYVVWEDNTLGNSEIFFAVSNDNGQTFSTPENISNNTGFSFAPQISSEGNNVYVVWTDDASEIFFAVSNDNGQTFSTPENISNNTGLSVSPQISSEGNNVYVVWEDSTSGPAFLRDTFFAVSTDNGQTFSTPENISDNTGLSIRPQISSEGNNVYLVWTDETPGNRDIFFAVSNDNGQTFSSPPVNLSNNTGGSDGAQISSEGNNVYVVWADTTPGNDEIFFSVSNDNGQTFSSPPENLSNNTETSTRPQFSIEGTNVYIVWEEIFTNNVDIFFAVSNDNGQTFSSPPVNLSNNTGGSFGARISSEGNNVYVVWVDNTPGNDEIFFSVSNDNGQTFSSPPENLSNNPGSSGFVFRGIGGVAEISSEGNGVYTVWNDDTPGNLDILTAISNDNGQTFSSPPENLSNNTGVSEKPQISSSTS
jgi:hypothetical protein